MAQRLPNILTKQKANLTISPQSYELKDINLKPSTTTNLALKEEENRTISFTTAHTTLTSPTGAPNLSNHALSPASLTNKKKNQQRFTPQPPQQQHYQTLNYTPFTSLVKAHRLHLQHRHTQQQQLNKTQTLSTYKPSQISNHHLTHGHGDDLNGQNVHVPQTLNLKYNFSIGRTHTSKSNSGDASAQFNVHRKQLRIRSVVGRKSGSSSGCAKITNIEQFQEEGHQWVRNKAWNYHMVKRKGARSVLRNQIANAKQFGDDLRNNSNFLDYHNKTDQKMGDVNVQDYVPALEKNFRLGLASPKSSVFTRVLILLVLMVDLGIS